MKAQLLARHLSFFVGGIPRRRFPPFLLHPPALYQLCGAPPPHPSPSGRLAADPPVRSFFMRAASPVSRYLSRRDRAPGAPLRKRRPGSVFSRIPVSQTRNARDLPVAGVDHWSE